MVLLCFCAALWANAPEHEGAACNGAARGVGSGFAYVGYGAGGYVGHCAALLAYHMQMTVVYRIKPVRVAGNGYAAYHAGIHQLIKVAVYRGKADCAIGGGAYGIVKLLRSGMGAETHEGLHD